MLKLIQRANAVASGQTVLSTSPPFIVYSPEVLTITRNGEETVLIPAVKIETLTIVESSLTEADLDNLEWTHKGESFMDGLATGNSIGSLDQNPSLCYLYKGYRVICFSKITVFYNISY